jgi:hypothetical protein
MIPFWTNLEGRKDASLRMFGAEIILFGVRVMVFEGGAVGYVLWGMYGDVTIFEGAKVTSLATADGE